MRQMSDTLWAVEQPKSIEMGMLKVGDDDDDGVRELLVTVEHEEWTSA